MNRHRPVPTSVAAPVVHEPVGTAYSPSYGESLMNAPPAGAVRFLHDRRPTQLRLLNLLCPEFFLVCFLHAVLWMNTRTDSIEREPSTHDQPGVLPVSQTREQIRTFYDRISRVYDLLQGRRRGSAPAHLPMVAPPFSRLHELPSDLRPSRDRSCRVRRAAGDRHPHVDTRGNRSR